MDSDELELEDHDRLPPVTANSSQLSSGRSPPLSPRSLSVATQPDAVLPTRMRAAGRPPAGRAGPFDSGKEQSAEMR